MHHGKNLFSRLPYSLVFKDKNLEKQLIELAHCDFDCIQFEFLPLAHYASIFPPEIKKIMVLHYIAFESRKRLMALWEPSLRKLYYRMELQKIRKYEKEVLNQSDSCIVTNEIHRDRLISWGVDTNINVNPNGVDVDYFSPQIARFKQKKASHAPKLAYMGAYHLEPANIDGLLYLIEEILPLIKKRFSNIQLDIIGRGLPNAIIEKYKNHNIHFHGYIDDIRPIMEKADAFVIPLRGGSGTKIRILTAMSMMIPVVATSKAAEGLDVAPDENILIGDTPDLFANQTEKILTDQKLNQNLAIGGRKLVEEKYSWRIIADGLGEIYESILK